MMSDRAYLVEKEQYFRYNSPPPPSSLHTSRPTRQVPLGEWDTTLKTYDKNGIKGPNDSGSIGEPLAKETRTKHCVYMILMTYLLSRVGGGDPSFIDVA